MSDLLEWLNVPVWVCRAFEHRRLPLMYKCFITSEKAGWHVLALLAVILVCRQPALAAVFVSCISDRRGSAVDVCFSVLWLCCPDRNSRHYCIRRSRCEHILHVNALMSFWFSWYFAPSAAVGGEESENTLFSRYTPQFFYKLVLRGGFECSASEANLRKLMESCCFPHQTSSVSQYKIWSESAEVWRCVFPDMTGWRSLHLKE